VLANALQDQGIPWPDHERVAFGLTKAEMGRMEQPTREATTASPGSSQGPRNQEVDTAVSKPPGPLPDLGDGHGPAPIPPSLFPVILEPADPAPITRDIC
jgi:hypothetical protein